MLPNHNIPPERLNFAFILFIVVIVVSVYIFNPDNISIRMQSLEMKNISSSKISEQCIVILRNGIGRLGNHLFLFASSVGLALDHSCHLHIAPKFLSALEPWFEINVRNLSYIRDLNTSKPIKKVYTLCSYIPKLFYPNTSQIIELSGFWQSYKFFVNQTDEIRRQLKFKKSNIRPSKSLSR